MKTAINTQSQNEVKDLLNEYVVSPLNTDISVTLSKMSAEIELLGETTKADINKVSSSINGNISRLQGLLDLSFHFDDEEDAFEKLNDKIEDSQKELSDIYTGIETIITKLKSNFEQADVRIIDAAEKNKQELLSSSLKHFKELDGAVKKAQTELEKSTKDIKDELLSFKSSTSNELVSLFTLTKESFEESNKKSSGIIEKIQEIEKKIQEIENLINQNNGLTEHINTTSQAISDTFKEQRTIICGYHEESKTAINTIEAQQQTFMEERYKKLFTISLSFGILNTIGFITIIVLYLMK